jgi:hypothetical protein
VLFDLEEIIRDYLVTFPFSLQPLLHQLDKNLNDWRAHFKKPSAKAPEWFDNLAIAGSTLDQVEKLNYENTLAVLEANKEFNFQDPFKIKNRELFDLHVGINSGFVLNPLGKKEYAAYNMLKWVEVRKPRNLVVHMGHNDGLYEIGGDARPGEALSDAGHCSVKSGFADASAVYKKEECH